MESLTFVIAAKCKIAFIGFLSFKNGWCPEIIFLSPVDFKDKKCYQALWVLKVSFLQVGVGQDSHLLLMP